LTIEKIVNNLLPLPKLHVEKKS